MMRSEKEEKAVMEIAWKKTYEVGNLEIDAEHKIFVRIIQKIQRALEHTTEKGYLERLVIELYKYADFHFCSEENVMIAVGYPELAHHQEAHKQLLVELSSLISVFGEEKRELQNLPQFLMNWFVNHTLAEDKKVGNYIKHEGTSSQ
ncbi:bacteriohemerythrin [candidate division KSB3 bacterium]|uniref:Bacteriohemerythrin n=1 Tax=candidate division KSB3 bacterium TaxID=2044937 RepID=A0A9D5JUG7_9BACT|nr:bacteriohemerythrin [candidate division KSB3 bacterium]MBD3324474.1 bacteriohemerythrin [candidate division KSB3 bacterium]